MSSVNKVILLGRVGQEPKRIHTEFTNIAKFSMATGNKYTDKYGKEVDTTEWHYITAFGKLADVVMNYVNKGSQIYVEGSIKSSKYEKDGVEHYAYGINAYNIVLIGAKKEETGSVKDRVKEEQKTENTAKYEDIFDDDIPF